MADPWRDLSAKEWCLWWDDPEYWRGFQRVQIGGQSMVLDFAKGSVPTITGRVEACGASRER